MPTPTPKTVNSSNNGKPKGTNNKPSNKNSK